MTAPASPAPASPAPPSPARARPAPVTLSPAAEARIAALMARGDAHGLRIGLKKGGCAGMEYTMELADAPSPGEEVITQGAARVLIAPAAQMFLFGTVVDYEDGLLDAGFRFRNPNVTESCGCGESVSFALPGRGGADTPA